MKFECKPKNILSSRSYQILEEDIEGNIPKITNFRINEKKVSTVCLLSRRKVITKAKSINRNVNNKQKKNSTEVNSIWIKEESKFENHQTSNPNVALSS